MSSYWRRMVNKTSILRGFGEFEPAIDMSFRARKSARFRNYFLTKLHFFERFFHLVFWMQAHSTLFSQITSNLQAWEFSRLSRRFPTAKPTRGLTQDDHFLALCFGQLTYRESLRDIVGCLNAKPKLLYHLGFRGRLTRTNLAYANQHRDWRLFEAIAGTLMGRAAALYQNDSSGLDLPGLVFALDASIISLALNLFPWGYYARTKQAALKLHLMLSLQGNLPAWAVLTDPQVGNRSKPST